MPAWKESLKEKSAFVTATFFQDFDHLFESRFQGFCWYSQLSVLKRETGTSNRYPFKLILNASGKGDLFP